MIDRDSSEEEVNHSSISVKAVEKNEENKSAENKFVQKFLVATKELKRLLAQETRLKTLLYG